MRSVEILRNLGRSSTRPVHGLAARRFGRLPHQGNLSRQAEPTAVTAVRHGDGVFEIRLAGAARRNALGREAIDAIESLASVPPLGTRVILITAEGPDFCAGYDLFEASRTGAERLIAHPGNFSFLKRAGVPVIAVLHGNVIGGGLELALAADIRLASADTRFAIPANRLGLIYSEEGVRLLVSELGESVTRAMLLGGMTLSAEEARAKGVVAEIVAAVDLETRALELARTITAWPALATSGNRRVLDAVVGRIAEDLVALRRTSFVEGGDLSLTIERFVNRRDTPEARRQAARRTDVRRVSANLVARIASGGSLLRRAGQQVLDARALRRSIRARES